MFLSIVIKYLLIYIKLVNLLQGLLWFYAHDPDSGVPANVRAGINKYGLCKDEWPENNHWPPQLYVQTETARQGGGAMMEGIT